MLRLTSWKRSWLPFWCTILWCWGGIHYHQHQQQQQRRKSFHDAFSITTRTTTTVLRNIQHGCPTKQYCHWNTRTPSSNTAIDRTLSMLVSSMTSVQRSAAFVFTIAEEEHHSSRSVLDITTTTVTTKVVVQVNVSSISSPRLWLESLPNGAYTVIRCDYYNNYNTKVESERYIDQWKIWGMDYHLRRLQQSYLAFHGLTDHGTLPSTGSFSRDDSECGMYITKALDDTMAICSTLKSNKELWQHDENESVANEGPTTIMLTILWYKDIERNTIQVIAHATKSNITTATPPLWNIVLHTTSTPLIHRQVYPQPWAKVSTWCQQRRPLERKYMPTSFISLSKPRNSRNECNGVNEPISVTINEIILTQPIATTGHIQLLEGLTSNLFVVYPNQVIRTAGQGILFGYVRHMLLELLSAPSNNDTTMETYVVDTSAPILMNDVNEWQEVFCTSSIRLIVPVERVFVPCASDNSGTDHTPNGTVRELWSRTNTNQGKELIWKKLQALLLDKDNP